MIAPEPFVEAVVLAGGLVAARGSDEQRKELLGGLSSGRAGPAFAWSDPTGGEGGVTVDGDTLTGVKEPVLNGGRADVLVVVRARDQLFLVDAKDLAEGARTSYPTFDGGRAARIAFDKTPATPLGEGGDATEATKDVDRRGDRRLLPRGAGRDGLGAQADHGVPHHPQAVRRHAQPVPGADLPRGRHVHLASS